MRVNFKDATLLDIESDNNIDKNISTLVFTFEERNDEYDIENIFKVYFELKSDYIKVFTEDVVDNTGNTDYSDTTIDKFFNTLKRYYGTIDKFCYISKLILIKA